MSGALAGRAAELGALQACSVSDGGLLRRRDGHEAERFDLSLVLDVLAVGCLQDFGWKSLAGIGK